jgi:hypothetical protein
VRIMFFLTRAFACVWFFMAVAGAFITIGWLFKALARTFA